jgi:hypothetical protein
MLYRRPSADGEQIAKNRDPGGGAMPAEWIKVATFASGLDADIARATLEEADIPVQVRAPHIGVFGPSFQGPVLGGVDVYVPSPELDRARDLLEPPP